MKSPAIKLPAPALTAEQRAALDRAKKPRLHPYRAHNHGYAQAIREEDARKQRIAPKLHRMVR